MSFINQGCQVSAKRPSQKSTQKYLKLSQTRERLLNRKMSISHVFLILLKSISPFFSLILFSLSYSGARPVHHRHTIYTCTLALFGKFIRFNSDYLRYDRIVMSMEDLNKSDLATLLLLVYEMELEKSCPHGRL